MRRIEAGITALALFALTVVRASAATAPAVAPSPGPASFVLFPQKQVLVLMYHQVTNTPDSVNLGAGHYGPAITPKQFDSDLAYLHARGFTSVDPLKALAYLDGRADAASLPEHPFAVTFDDGFVSAWTDATPILRRHHVKAMMFVEGKRVDLTPGRITAAQIKAMVASGVWEMESHGYTGHWALQIGPNATDLSPYWYANLGWVVKKHRLETPVEFEDRLIADFAKSRQTLGAIAGTPVTVFAYPSGEYGQNIPLPAGADPDVFAGEQGHSNATGLTPYIEAALRRAGIDTAFAVVVPGTEAAASQADAPYWFSRIGESPRTYDPDVSVLTDGAIKLPSISPAYHWVDCRSVLGMPDSFWVAGNAAPFIYHLDAMTGKVQEVVEVKALQTGREGQPVLAVALMPEADGSFLAYQQKGWWDGGQARLVSFRIERSTAVDVKTTPLDEDAAWFVGMAMVNGKPVGLTEDGALYAVDRGTAQALPFAFPNDSPGWKRDDVGRFAGLAYAHGLLYAVDRKSNRLLGIDPTSGVVKEAADVTAGTDIRAVGGDDHYLWLVNYAHERRTVLRWRSTSTSSP
ncbi:MAG: polysaccharide deacetylase family protein [Candidatus Eremiobacteraeota bacterium]|nr:polysaccharide deacetylase family protein [Candidatus Eremiobacteraeota bacterium]